MSTKKRDVHSPKIPIGKVTNQVTLKRDKLHFDAFLKKTKNFFLTQKSVFSKERNTTNKTQCIHNDSRSIILFKKIIYKSINYSNLIHKYHPFFFFF